MDLRNDDGEAAAAFYDKRRKWMDYVSEHPRIGHASFRVGYWLARRMNGQDQCCWWGSKQIARLTGCSLRTVLSAIAELEAEGLLIVVRKPGRGSTYFIRVPFG